MSVVERDVRERGDWVINHPDSIDSFWPRPDARMVEGPPKATDAYSTMELEEMGMVGIFLDEDIPDGIFSRRNLDRPVDIDSVDQ